MRKVEGIMEKKMETVGIIGFDLGTYGRPLRTDTKIQQHSQMSRLLGKP